MEALKISSLGEAAMRIKIRRAARRQGVSLAVALSALGWAGSTDVAFGNGGCPVVSYAVIEQVIGLHHAHNDAPAESEPGGKIQSCELFLYNGQYFGPGRKYSQKKLEAQMARGSAAQVSIKGMVSDGSDEGDFVEGFNRSVGAAQNGSGFLGLGPRISVPLSGASGAAADQFATAKATHNAAGLWWQTTNHKVLEIAVAESKRKPVAQHLRQIANLVLPPFFG
jgi:hypothetical protein